MEEETGGGSEGVDLPAGVYAARYGCIRGVLGVYQGCIRGVLGVY